jgi:hypothetical protein
MTEFSCIPRNIYEKTEENYIYVIQGRKGEILKFSQNNTLNFLRLKP